MARFAIRRLGAALLTVFLVVTITFFLAHLAPGEPMLGDSERLRADPARVARVRAEFGLDRPMPVQYAMYVGNAMRGRLGDSFVAHRPAFDVLRERLPRTALLAGTSLLLAFAAGIALATLQARRAGARADAAIGAVTMLFHSTPSFWLGMILLLAGAQWLGWLPVSGMTTPVEHDTMGAMGRMLDVVRHLVLPALTLALVQTAEIARFQRGALVDALGSGFVRAARARGSAERSLTLRHALRASLGPVITLAGMSVPALLAGSVLVESVFGWPGMGRMTHEAIIARDYNVILAAAILSGGLVALGNLAADIAVRWLDPRTAA